MSDAAPSIDETTELIFDNAIRYLTRSIKSLENDEPAFAIVEFYTAIELILKARLSVEHWTLVVRDPDKADRTSYISGDCNTVGLQEAHNRLKKVAGDSVDESLYNVFDSLRQHRNRAVHFYHDAAVDEAARDLAAGEMCRAWHPLYSVVTGRWADKFNKEEIESLQSADYDFRQIRKYLEVRYEQVREETERATATGTQCSDCPACSFPTLLHVGEYKDLLAAYSCQVCMYGDVKLEVSCPTAECAGMVHIEYAGTGTCPRCTNQLTTLAAAELIQPAQDRGGVHDPRAHCMTCDIPADGPTVARVNDQYLCCNCFAKISKDEIDQCEHCGELQTDLPDLSGLYGCNMCEGQQIDDD